MGGRGRRTHDEVYRGRGRHNSGSAMRERKWHTTQQSCALCECRGTTSVFPLVFYALWQCVLVADSKETRRNKNSNKENNRERVGRREWGGKGRVKQTSSAKLVYECWLLGQRPHDKAANWNWGLVLVVVVPSKGYPRAWTRQVTGAPLLIVMKVLAWKWPTSSLVNCNEGPTLHLRGYLIT